MLNISYRIVRSSTILAALALAACAAQTPPVEEPDTTRKDQPATGEDDAPQIECGDQPIDAPITARGMLTFDDLEGGLWLLESEAGEVYQLDGDLGDVESGMQVEIEGTAHHCAPTIGQAGTPVTVAAIRAL
jgi:hypothetical protein